MDSVHRGYWYSVSLLAAAACWGTAAVISKRAVEEIEPLTLLPIELMVSVAVLSLGLAVTRERVSWSLETRRLTALGVLNPGVSYALSLAGLVRITASMSVLLWAIEPLLILAFAFWILRDRISGQMAFCAATAAIGVMLVVFQPGTAATVAGILLTLGGVTACGLYTVLSSKYLAEASSLSVVWLQQVAALAFSLILLAGSFAVSEPRSLVGVSSTAWVSAAAAGVLYYGVAFWFYVIGLRELGAGRAGLFINLVPVFGLAVSYLALDERLVGRQWIGALLIVGALIAMSMFAARRRTRCPQGRPS